MSFALRCSLICMGIVVTPTAVGGGTPFFPTLPSWISLRLLENRTFPGGTVLLRYEAKHD
jgi:hypothetical protein